jgi:hypothetical protein
MFPALGANWGSLLRELGRRAQMSVSEGDAKGVWFEVSPYVLKATAPLVAVSLLLQAASGPLDGFVGGAQQLAEAVLVLSAVTEVIKLVTSLGL